MPPGVINMLPGDGLDVSAVALRAPRPRRHPLHRLDADVPAPVADGRREHRELPLLPAHRRRDRRQGLRGRPPVGRRRRAAHRADPRRVRVPGPEVLGGLARLRRRGRVWNRMQGRARRRDRGASRWATSPTSRNFMGAVIDDACVRQAQEGDRPGQARRRSCTILAGGTVDDSVGYFVRPTVVESADPTDEMFTTEYFGPILAVHVYDDGDFETGRRPDGVVRAVRADRLDHRPGPRAPIAWAQERAALRRRQLLRQRQADRRGRRPAAVRRRAGLGHQRQGRRAREPAALDLAALDQGDVRTRRPTTATRYMGLG